MVLFCFFKKLNSLKSLLKTHKDLGEGIEMMEPSSGFFAMRFIFWITAHLLHGLQATNSLINYLHLILQAFVCLWLRFSEILPILSKIILVSTSHFPKRK